MFFSKRLWNTPFADESKVRKYLITGFSIEVLLFVGLYFAWYAEMDLVPFHFYNDLGEWLWVDKVGHYHFSFQSAFIFGFWMRLSGVERKRAAATGFLLGFMVLFPVEVFDGFSSGWGFSIADLVANTIGCSLAWLLLSRIERPFVFPKFSFHTTIYSLIRPEILGSHFMLQSVKDYNGQTYWFSFSPNVLVKRKIFPSWFLLSIGYGAEGMVGGYSNEFTRKDGTLVSMNDILRYPQFYISFDIDFSFLFGRKQNKKALIILQNGLYFLNWFKIPAPALEINQVQGLRFHWIYF